MCDVGHSFFFFNSLLLSFFACCQAAGAGLCRDSSSSDQISIGLEKWFGCSKLHSFDHDCGYRRPTNRAVQIGTQSDPM
jgi:hypothetical protein